MVPTMMLLIPEFLLFARDIGATQLALARPSSQAMNLALNTFLLRSFLPGHPTRARRAMS